MHDFLNTLKAIAAASDGTLDAAEVLAARLLDIAEIGIDDLTGVFMIRTGDPLLLKPIFQVLQAVSPDRVIDWRRSLTSTPQRTDIVTFYAGAHSSLHTALLACRQAGATILGIAPSYADLDELIVDLATDNRALDSVDGAIAYSVIVEVCSGEATADDRRALLDIDYVRPEHLLLAIGDGGSARETVSALLRLCGVAKKSAADPVPLGVAAAAVVTKLRDLYGYGEAKTWGLRLADDLRAYKAGELAWADVDRGILLSGPPGCGKTYFARSLASECGVELIATSYSDWHDAKGGDSVARNVKALFAKARKSAPCIVFIDELDSVGVRGQRAHNSGWFDTIINGLLAELDGAEPRDGVVVIGATNRPDEIDPALRRPGRLERHVAIPLPTVDDLRGVIMHQLGAGALSDGLDDAARACRGRSPADIALLAREARRIARMCKRSVCAGDLADVLFLSRTPRPPGEDHAIANHESGHALVAHLCGIAVQAVDLDKAETLVAHFDGGATPEDVERHLAVAMGGRAADELYGRGPCVGTITDLESATAIAISWLTKYGFGKRLVSLPAQVAILDPGVRAEVDRMLRKALETATALLTQHEPAFTELSRVLLARRYLDGAEVAAIVKAVGDEQEFRLGCGL